MSFAGDFVAGVGNFVGGAIDTIGQNLIGNAFAGVNAKTQAKAYNKYQNIVYPQDSLRMRDRMDILYPGTSSFERLGVQPPNPIQGPDGAETSSFLPLQIASLQAKTQLEAERIRQDTAIKTTGMQTGTQTAINEATLAQSMELARRLSADWKIPESQLKLNEMQALLTAANTAVANETVGKITAEIANIRQSTDESRSRVDVNQANIRESWARMRKMDQEIVESKRRVQSADVTDRLASAQTWAASASADWSDAQRLALGDRIVMEQMAAVLNAMPQEILRSGPYERRQKDGWQEVVGLIGTTGRLTPEQLRETLGKVQGDDFDAFWDWYQKSLGVITGGSNVASDFAGAIGDSRAAFSGRSGGVRRAPRADAEYPRYEGTNRMIPEDVQ